MGYVTSRARNDFLPLSITLHLLLIASVVIAMTAQWAKVNFHVTNPSWVVDTGHNTNAGAFSCPTNTWYLFAYNGFCSDRHLDRGSRGDPDDTNCITWDNEKPWRKMDDQNLLGSNFSNGRELWQTTGALLALSLFLSCITIVTTSLPSLFDPWSLGISAFLISLNFNACLVSWIVAKTSDQMTPNFWDGMEGCGNSSFHQEAGFGFAVVATALALFLFLLTVVAAVAEGLARFNTAYEVKERRPSVGDEAKYDVTRPEDRQVQGYRPDIVA